MPYRFEHLQYETMGVVVIGVFCMVLLVLTTRSARLCPSRLRFTTFLKGDRGAVYPLSLALALPFYALLLATITECALMIVVKLGTMNAAYAAARSAIVWRAAEIDPGRQQARIHLAAAQAMTPMASSKEIHLQPIPLAIGNEFQADAFYAAYRTYSDGEAPRDYLARKLRYAMAATEVEIEEVSNGVDRDFTSDLHVTVTYEKPIDLPVVGTFLGSQASWPGARFFTRRIETSLVMQKEGAKSSTRTLGINYDSWNY